jgi:hypothetical protein
MTVSPRYVAGSGRSDQLELMRIRRWCGHADAYAPPWPRARPAAAPEEVAVFVIEPTADGRSWTYSLRTDDGEVLALAGRPHPNSDECAAAIAEIMGPYEFDLSVNQRGDGRWSWEMGKSGRPLLVSPRTHALPAQCGAAMRRVKHLVEESARRATGDRRRPEI